MFAKILRQSILQWITNSWSASVDANVISRTCMNTYNVQLHACTYMIIHVSTSITHHRHQCIHLLKSTVESTVLSTSSPLSYRISISDRLLPRNQQVQRDQLRQFHAAHLEYLLHQVSENRYNGECQREYNGGHSGEYNQHYPTFYTWVQNGCVSENKYNRYGTRSRMAMFIGKSWL